MLIMSAPGNSERFPKVISSFEIVDAYGEINRKVLYRYNGTSEMARSLRAGVFRFCPQRGVRIPLELS